MSKHYWSSLGRVRTFVGVKGRRVRCHLIGRLLHVALCLCLCFKFFLMQGYEIKWVMRKSRMKGQNDD